MKTCWMDGMHFLAASPSIFSLTGTFLQPSTQSPFFFAMTSNVRFVNVHFKGS